jgi:hypothetical protein
MAKNTFFRLSVITSFLFSSFTSLAQFIFTNSNSLISNVSHSGNTVGVVDVNNDGLDDLVRMDESHHLFLDLQKQDGTFSFTDLGDVSGTCGTNCLVWGMALADVDHNGWKDIVTGTRNDPFLIKLSLVGNVVTPAQTSLSGSYFVQNITFGDFDNDGWVDLGICDDVDYMKIYKNNSGTLTLQSPGSALINTNINPGMTYAGGDPYDSGNYGSVWTDFDNDGDLDLYIAHCRQIATSSSDQRRRDRLFVNNGSNVFTEAAATYGIEVSNYRQTWTTSFGDIDNDGDFDILMMNHSAPSQILENDGSGHFSDITLSTNFSWDNDGIESILEDFDNDGYLDILLSGGGGNWVYHNNGNKTFTEVSGTFPVQASAMLSFATGDLNHDGKIDVYSTYGSGYNTPTSTDDVLYLNNTNNENHFITFNLTGTASNVNAIGARAIIHGSFGTQVREVRAGETYGTANSMQLHFGLGSSDSITSAAIEWPAGGTTTFGALPADQFVTVIENTCSVTGNIIPGPVILCTGQSTTLTALNGADSYLWSTGDVTQSITTSTNGKYNVMITSGSCTNISPTIGVFLNPDQTPEITSAGISSCEGVYTLTSSAALGYTWTGPNSFSANTQNINPIVSGTYSLTIQGNCANFTAAPITVSILSAPSSPTVTGASGTGPASYNLSAAGTGGNLSWYDMSSGGNLLGTGNTYTTPVINSTTTYYVEDATIYPGANYTTGQINHTGSSLYSVGSVSGGEDFNVTTACTINTVKVYTATYGTRQIQLLNSAGNVIDYVDVNLTSDTTVVTLNFNVSTGSGYRIVTNTAVNNTNFGSASPALQRSTTGVSYPYTIAGVLSITNGWTGTTTSSSAYYYFYDWKVSTPSSVCKSPRVPVIAEVTSVGIPENTKEGLAFVYPNPANDKLNISLNKVTSGKAIINIIDLAGRIVARGSFDANEKMEMNISALARGAYMIKVITGETQRIQRLVKN